MENRYLPFDYEQYLIKKKYPYLKAFLDNEFFPPFEIELQVTNTCNHKCKWCIGQKTLETAHEKSVKNRINKDNISTIINNIINYQLQSDIKSEGIIKIGRPKEMDKYYDNLFKKADSKSECRFSGHSLLKFLVYDYSNQKDNFIDHIQKGMKLFVLLKFDDKKQQSQEVTDAQIAENLMLGRERNFSMDLEKTLDGIEQMRNKLKNDIKNNIKVRVTSQIMYTGINWIKKQNSEKDDGEMIVTHYMHQGMAERSRAIHIKAPCILISDYREEFDNLWDKETDVPFDD